jgi:hypothetical protein
MIVSSLETRVTNRKQELIAEIVELKLGSRLQRLETIDKLKARLSELAIILDEGVGHGWANVGPRTRRKLDEWISR